MDPFDDAAPDPRCGLDADQPVVVVGDSHGQVGKVARLVADLRTRGVLDDHRLVFLGDHLDRGPDPRALVELCLELQADGHVFLSGNHEHVLVRALEEHDAGDPYGEWTERWADRYEVGVLRSYGASVSSHRPSDRIAAMAEALPPAHRAFLESMPWMLELDHVVAVHAGVHRDRPWPLQRRDLSHRHTINPRGPASLHSHQWASDPSPIAGLPGVTLVTGHRSRRTAHVAPGRVMIDTGAGDFDGPVSGWISSTGEVVASH